MNLTAADGARVLAYLASPGDPPQAHVVILPDVRGLHEFYRELALRFAEIGVRALAIDYFSRTADTDNRDASFEYGPHVQQMTPETFRQDLEAAIPRLQEEVDPGLPIFTVGFCMGGALSFWAGANEFGLAGVVGFYGALNRNVGAVTPVLDWAATSKAPVLGLFGGADQGILQKDIDVFDRKLEEAGVPHELVVYPGATHSFFDRRQTEFAQASADAWTRIQEFIADAKPLQV